MPDHIPDAISIRYTYGAEEVTDEELQACAYALKLLDAGELYVSQDRAMREMFGRGVRFMPEEK